MTPKVAVLLAALCALAPGRLAAQAGLVRTTVDSGTLVRMYPPTGAPVRGRLVQALDPTSAAVLFCRYPAPPCADPSDSAAIQQLPTMSLSRLEVQRGSHWGVGAALGGLVGLFLGVATEALASMDCNESNSCPVSGLITGVGVLTFGTIGAMVGGSSPKWGPAP